MYEEEEEEEEGRKTEGNQLENLEEFAKNKNNFFHAKVSKQYSTLFTAPQSIETGSGEQGPAKKFCRFPLETIAGDLFLVRSK
ncbi:hypothetical protein RUM44_010185 [Polyplax serrata]|uniref:Uncharacterized protein n=1 Tax=Polyplax serrata TaxID=468196 RepID=A0ABR1AUV4_POLSC